MEHKTQKPKLKPWEITVAILSASLAIVAALITVFYTVDHGSLADVFIANVPVKATTSQSELQKQINVAASEYKVTLQYPDGSRMSFALAVTGVKVDAQRSAADAKLAINHLLMRRLEWWRPLRLNLITTTDSKTFQAFVADDAIKVKTPPKDANLSIVNGAITVSQEVQGSGSTLLNPSFAITQAVANLQSAPLILKPAKLSAAISSKSLQPSQDKAQALLNQKVVFTIAGHTVSPKPTDIANWIELTPVPKSKTVDVTVDSGQILQYINNIAKLYIQPPRSRLVMTTSEGQVVLDPGADGVDVVNKNQTAASVAQQLLQGKGVNIDLPVNYAAAQTVEAQSYPKWIVVDLTNKRMYAYEQDTLVRSFLVSAGAPATPTPVGHFAIYAKYVSQDMSGFNTDGSRYFQPAVPYVNYFTGGDAIHGNYWRPASYFGNINSSHGCVGIPVGDAAWMYDWAPIGTPVITHT